MRNVAHLVLFSADCWGMLLDKMFGSWIDEWQQACARHTASSSATSSSSFSFFLLLIKLDSRCGECLVGCHWNLKGWLRFSWSFLLHVFPFWHSVFARAPYHGAAWWLIKLLHMSPLCLFFGRYLFLAKGWIILIVISILMERSHGADCVCSRSGAWGLQQMLTSQKKSV